MPVPTSMSMTLAIFDIMFLNVLLRVGSFARQQHKSSFYLFKNENTKYSYGVYVDGYVFQVHAQCCVIGTSTVSCSEKKLTKLTKLGLAGGRNAMRPMVVHCVVRSLGI